MDVAAWWLGWMGWQTTRTSNCDEMRWRVGERAAGAAVDVSA